MGEYFVLLHDANLGSPLRGENIGEASCLNNIEHLKIRRTYEESHVSQPRLIPRTCFESLALQSLAKARIPGVDGGLLVISWYSSTNKFSDRFCREAV